MDLGDDRPAEPTENSINLAIRVVDNQYALSDLLVEEVWRDLNGLGPRSGMWWHGDWATIREMVLSGWKRAQPPPVDSKEDLYLHMGNVRIYIGDQGSDCPSGCIRFAVDSAIDPEHGVGVLSDGIQILGVGYSYAVSPFPVR